MNPAGWALDLWHAASALRQAAFAVAEAGGRATDDDYARLWAALTALDRVLGLVA